jgi:hypothetical protein
VFCAHVRSMVCSDGCMLREKPLTLCESRCLHVLVLQLVPDSRSCKSTQKHPIFHVPTFPHLQEPWERGQARGVVSNTLSVRTYRVRVKTMGPKFHSRRYKKLLNGHKARVQD